VPKYKKHNAGLRRKESGKMGHTKGEWKADGYNGRDGICIWCDKPYPMTEDERRDNALLIAAAPALLEALEACDLLLRKQAGPDSQLHKQVQQAIAAVEGK